MKINLAWFLFYGRQMGMGRFETLSCPVGEMLDMVACLQISNGAPPKIYGDVDDLMNLR